MNSNPSFKEVLGPVLSVITGSQTPKRSFFRRLIPAITSATAAISLSACTSTAPSMAGQVERSTGIAVLSTHSNESLEVPSDFEIPSPDSREDFCLFEEPKQDYLTSLLRDLPWSVR